MAQQFEDTPYGDWWDIVNAIDFVGVQAYFRFRIGADGIVPNPPGTEMTGAGYEYYPAALGGAIRLAARKLKPSARHFAQLISG